MATIQELFDYARLATAAYVDLAGVNLNAPNAVVNAAIGQKFMPSTLADLTFTSDPTGAWTVVHSDTADNAVTGFSAMLFERNGKYVLGIRGTEPDGLSVNSSSQFWLDLLGAETQVGGAGDGLSTHSERAVFGATGHDLISTRRATWHAPPGRRRRGATAGGRALP
jgi:hypothetical protein